MWNLYLEAKTFNCPPSQLLGIDDPYAAYCLDQAVNVWGIHVTSELDKIDEGKKDAKQVATSKRTAAKRERKLHELLQSPGEKPKFKSFRAQAGKAPTK